MCYHQCVLASYIHPVPQLDVLLQHGSAAERFLTITAQPAGTNSQTKKKVTRQARVMDNSVKQKKLTGNKSHGLPLCAYP